MDHPTSSINPTDGGLLEETKKYSDFVRVAALSVGIPIIIFGFLGNLMTIIAVIKTKALRTGANIFIISLAVFDLMYVTIVIPTTVNTIWNNSWVFSQIYCTTFPLLLSLAVGGNLTSLYGTAVIRYLKIIWPKLFSYMFGRQLYIAIFVSSFMSLPVLIVMPPIVGVWGKLGYEPKTLSCTILRDNSGYNTFVMLCSFVIPIIFISFCYLCILRKVCSNRKKIQAARNGDGNHQPAAVREDIRYTKMMVSIFTVFIFACTPYFINALFDPSAKHMTRRFVTLVCIWFNSCINPILYGLLNRNFRKAFVNIFKEVKELTTVSRSGEVTNE